MNKPITVCDECSEEFYQEDLINIDMATSDELHNLKEEYKNFDGMVCEECYSKMAIV